MSNDYASDDSGYRDRYVAFLDILGFSQLTEMADQHPSWRAWLRDCIGALRQTVPTHNDHTGFRSVQFSDSIVMSADRTPQGLNTILWSVKMLARNMLHRGILLRGGVAAGNFHHDDNLMFGPALIRAYAFEQHGAPPHVALHHAVIEDLKPSLISPGLMHWLTDDPWDLSPILHTMADFGAYDGIPREGGEPLEGAAFALARMIDGRAKDMSSPPAVRAKWRWMQDYWNQSVAGKGILLISRSYENWDVEYQRAMQGANDRLAFYNAQQALNGPSPSNNG